MSKSQTDSTEKNDLDESTLARRREILSRAESPEPETTEPLTLLLPGYLADEFKQSFHEDGDMTDVSSAIINRFIEYSSTEAPLTEVLDAETAEEVVQVTVRVTPEARRRYTEAVTNKRMESSPLSDAVSAHGSVIAAGLANWREAVGERDANDELDQ